ncbi:MAG TPA: Wzz/FepE/Etk N-terminal domain-containing protein [Draconibacterium sp.]|nr:Wzz/FepE/Etk N-terminal domain-containing protein [Draconibacterium sp.]
MNNFFDNQRILSLIWKRKFHFIVVGIIAIFLGAIFSGPTFIKPKFKSTARLYPTNLGEMSEESKTEQMLEIINSNAVKFKMFDAFESKDIFNISKEDPHYLTYIFDIYNENVKTSKTQNETVEIKVMAYDPQIASDMCDSIIHFYNQTVGNMYKAKNWEMVGISEKQLKKKYAEVDSLIQRLTQIRTETGIVDVENQVPEVTRGYVKALVDGGGNSADVNRIKEIFGNLLKKGAEARSLEVSFEAVLEEIVKIKAVYELNLNEYEKNITYSHIVEHPFAADDKSYPVRWLIVAFSAFSAVFLALLVFLVLDYRKVE